MLGTLLSHDALTMTARLVLAQPTLHGHVADGVPAGVASSRLIQISAYIHVLLHHCASVTQSELRNLS
jgi:hypothetical protein